MVAVFAALAAVVPIFGSLYVSISALVRHRSRTKELEVRRRHAAEQDASLARRINQRMNEVDFENQEREQEQMDARHRAELDENGYAHDPVWTEVPVQAAMSGMPMPKPEYRDQWILIVSAAAGVVFLAFSWLLVL